MEKDELKYKKLEKEEKKLIEKKEELELKLAIVQEEKEKIIANQAVAICKERNINLFDLYTLLSGEKEKKHETKIDSKQESIH